MSRNCAYLGVCESRPGCDKFPACKGHACAPSVASEPSTPQPRWPVPIEMDGPYESTVWADFWRIAALALGAFAAVGLLCFTAGYLAGRLL